MEGYLNLLLEQLNKNIQINKFAKREREAIAVGDIGIVMESDALRKEIISQLQSLQTEMDPYLEDFPKSLEDTSPQLKDQILTVSKQLYEIIEETIAIDRENEIKLKEIKEGVREKIKGIGKGKQALSGYKSPSQNKPKLFDGEV
ncbi:MAG: hypothetical protein JRI87_06795 [Deltaproteobacteria bacterium]|nr:hypothetical protein [Deltaproteobacteria bacterium]